MLTTPYLIYPSDGGADGSESDAQAELLGCSATPKSGVSRHKCAMGERANHGGLVCRDVSGEALDDGTIDEDTISKWAIYKR